jgi:hypothetical protein
MEPTIISPPNPKAKIDEPIGRANKLVGGGVFSDRLFSSISVQGDAGLIKADYKLSTEEGIPLTEFDSENLAISCQNILTGVEILTGRNRYIHDSPNDDEINRINSLGNEGTIVKSYIRPLPLFMPSYIALKMQERSLAGFVDKIRIRDIHKRISPDDFRPKLDSLADIMHVENVSRILLGVASLTTASKQYRQEILSWAKHNLEGMLSDDRVAFQDAINSLQERLDILKRAKRPSSRHYDRLIKVSENVGFICAAEQQVMGELNDIWRAFVGDDFQGEEPHFIQEMDRLAQETKQREEKAQAPVAEEEHVKLSDEEYELARQQRVEEQARAEAAARAARAAEKQTAKERTETKWAQLQPDITAYQAAAQEYNRATRCNGEAEKLRELQHMLVVGYSARGGAEIEGIDKKLAADVIKLLIKIDAVDVRELTELHQKLAAERERLLQESRRLNHRSDIELTRLTDVPFAIEYIKNNYETLRVSLIRNWPSEQGLARDRELWNCLFPDREYNAPPGFRDAPVVDTLAPKPALKEPKQPEPEDTVPPATDVDDGAMDTDGDNEPTPPIKTAPNPGKENDDATTSEETTPAPATPAAPLPLGAVGTFSELPFTPFRIGERPPRTGFEEIDLSGIKKDDEKIAEMRRTAGGQVEDHIARNGRGKRADWNRLRLLLRIPGIFGADDAEFFRTARGGFTAVPPYFIAAFTAHGLPICMADSPITGNAIYLFRDDINAGTWQEMIEELTKGQARELGAARAFHSGSADDVRGNVIAKINGLLTTRVPR